MNQSKLIECQELKLIKKINDKEITNAYTSDLLSDVMANSSAGSLLITIQAHANTVAVCNLLELPAVIICNGRQPEQEMLSASEKNKVNIYLTELNQYQTSVLLAQLLNEN